MVRNILLISVSIYKIVVIGIIAFFLVLVTTEIPDEVETIPVELNLESADKIIRDEDPDREPTTSGPDTAAKPIEDP